MVVLRPRLAVVMMVAVAMLVAACGSLPVGERSAHIKQDLPALYAGVFPCNDCREVHYLLYLRPDGSFFQRTQFPGRPASDDIGRWFVSSDAERLILFGARPQRDQFSLEQNGELLQQVADGRALPQPARYRLNHQPATAPWQPELALIGLYSFANGRARFQECRTGLQLAVTDGAEARQLERGYFAARHNMGEQVLVSLRGRLAAAATDTWQLEVTQFELTMPGATCPPLPTAASLQTAQWQLVELAGQPVVAVGGEPAPHLQFAPGGALKGTTGCDELGGRYRLRGDRLTLEDVRTSEAACPGDTVFQMMLTETLRLVASWRTLGPLLELRDSAGRIVARLEAVAE